MILINATGFGKFLFFRRTIRKHQTRRPDGRIQPGTHSCDLTSCGSTASVLVLNLAAGWTKPNSNSQLLQGETEPCDELKWNDWRCHFT